MFKKTVKFENFNGEEVERDFYFHLSKSELLAMANDGADFKARVEKIQATSDVRAVIHEFRELVKLAVGVRSEDGARFIKDEEAQSLLLDSPAFDELLFELVSKPNAAVEFVKQLIPEKLQKELEEQMKNASENAPDPFKNPEDSRPAYQREHRFPTNAELQAMTKEEMQEAFAWRMKEAGEVVKGE
jgi:hypothetical protein